MPIISPLSAEIIRVLVWEYSLLAVILVGDCSGLLRGLVYSAMAMSIAKSIAIAISMAAVILMAIVKVAAIIR